MEYQPACRPVHTFNQSVPTPDPLLLRRLRNLSCLILSASRLPSLSYYHRGPRRSGMLAYVCPSTNEKMHVIGNAATWLWSMITSLEEPHLAFELLISCGLSMDRWYDERREQRNNEAYACFLW